MSAPIKLSCRETGGFWEIPTLFEDDHLLVLDKPAWLSTAPDPEAPQAPHLLGLMHDAIARGTPWTRDRGLTYVAAPAALDTDTTGVLLLAKQKPALVHLANQFGSERTEHQFVGLAQGTPLEPTFRVDAKLAPHPARPGYIRVDPRQGKKSATRFELIETFAGYSLLRCRPVSTCRHHQIRVHLRSAQLPLVGDPLYGGRALLLSRLKPGYRFKEDRDELPLLGRSALHAERLNVIHPVTGLPLVFEAPWPKDLQVALKFLRRYAPSTAPATPSREPSEPTGGNKG